MILGLVVWESVVEITNKEGAAFNAIRLLRRSPFLTNFDSMAGDFFFYKF